MFKTEELCLTFFQERIKGQTRNLRWCPKLQNSRFLFYIFSKSVKKSVKRVVRVLRAKRVRREKKTYFYRLSPVSLSVFSLVPGLLFDCSGVLEFTQKYGLFCSLVVAGICEFQLLFFRGCDRTEVKYLGRPHISIDYLKRYQFKSTRDYLKANTAKYFNGDTKIA